MSASTGAITTSASVYSTGAFWERLWRTGGIQFVAISIISAVIYGNQPQIGASPEELTAFYDGHRVRILIAVAFSGLNLLNLLWFVAALRTALADAGRDGWGTAATVASAVFGGLSLLLFAVVAALAHSIAAGNPALTSGLNGFAWALLVLTAFPRAMLIMSGVFGLWRAGLISNAFFSAGVVAVVLGVLGGTTWMRGGVWAPDGVYSRFVMPVLLLVWVIAVGRVLNTRNAAARTGW